VSEPKSRVVMGESEIYPVWCKMPDGTMKWLSLEEAEAGDSPEGSVVIRISATLYKRMCEASRGRKRLPFTAGRFGP